MENNERAWVGRYTKVAKHRHEVFTLESDKGATVHIPALVLMRAFFRPNHLNGRVKSKVRYGSRLCENGIGS